MARSERILIAGRNGRVARDLVAEADRAGVPVRAVGRPELDIEDADSIARVIAPEAPRAIINAAGLVAVDEAERNPERAFALKRDGAARLAAVAASAGIPFLHLSSDYVFDGGKGAPYTEDDPVVPLSVYGRSKAEGEDAVLTANPAAIVVRTSWVFGANGSNFLTTMLRLAETQEVVRVVADQRGTPTASFDLARALLAMTLRLLRTPDEVTPGRYHVAGSGETTWYGFAEAIFAGWARRGRRVPRLDAISAADWSGPARRPSDSRLDCDKLARAFDIRLPDWHDALEACLDTLAAADARRG
jgi:dTDP-4-dehydrorhamnose reductase